MDSSTHLWREQVVRDAANPNDVDVFLSVTIPTDPLCDTLRWPHTMDGKVSVRSVYHCIHTADSVAQLDLNHSPPVDLPMVWPAIWNSGVWPKNESFHVENGFQLITYKEDAPTTGTGAVDDMLGL